jgi:hypothetical protein
LTAINISRAKKQGFFGMFILSIVKVGYKAWESQKGNKIYGTRDGHFCFYFALKKTFLS